ncbi:MAG: SPOR domain-containing protein [bacterium]
MADRWRLSLSTPAAVLPFKETTHGVRPAQCSGCIRRSGRDPAPGAAPARDRRTDADRSLRRASGLRTIEVSPDDHAGSQTVPNCHVAGNETVDRARAGRSACLRDDSAGAFRNSRCGSIERAAATAAARGDQHRTTDIESGPCAPVRADTTGNLRFEGCQHDGAATCRGCGAGHRRGARCRAPPSPLPPQPGAASPAAKTDASRTYVVQLGVFTSPQNAEALQRKLTEGGVSTFTETRVLIGPFRDRAEADRSMEIVKKLGLGAVVMPARP